MRHDYKYFVYMLNSSSRRALYTGITNGLVKRVIDHRRAENPKSFTAQYRVFRLVYYEEFGDVSAAIAREKQIKGWTRAKKNALVATMNPKWRDLMAEWEKKFGLVFQLDYRIVRAEEVRQQRHQIQGASQNQTQGPSPKIGAQDDTAF